MKVTTKQITQLTISDVEHLDPVTVTLDDMSPRHGKITITCYGSAWSAYWGGMGDRTISEFFCSCDEGYLISNLSPNGHRINKTVIDFDKINEDAEKHGLNHMDEQSMDYDTLQELYGEDWMHGDLPQVSNGDYTYLARIIAAVKSALNEERE